MKILIRVFFYSWEFFQNALGFCFFASFYFRKKIKKSYFERERYFVELQSVGAISLGMFVFYTAVDNSYVPVGLENKNHEYGHSVQSKILGPLYLPTVGIVSETRLLYAVFFKTIKGRRWSHYYDGFPENWADRLGKVDKSLRPKP
jgi:hypothetical protein